jgi:hypothetical protein
VSSSIWRVSPLIFCQTAPSILFGEIRWVDRTENVWRQSWSFSRGGVVERNCSTQSKCEYLLARTCEFLMSFSEAQKTWRCWRGKTVLFEKTEINYIQGELESESEDESKKKSKKKDTKKRKV